jgi:hypothetical protein
MTEAPMLEHHRGSANLEGSENILWRSNGGQPTDTARPEDGEAHRGKTSSVSELFGHRPEFSVVAACVGRTAPSAGFGGPQRGYVRSGGATAGAPDVPKPHKQH